MNATQIASFGSIGSEKIFSDTFSALILDAVGGNGIIISSSGGKNSLLKGGRTDPVTPYSTASVSRVFLVAAALLPLACTRTDVNLLESGCIVR